MDEPKKKSLIESFLTRGVENIIPNREELEKVLTSGKTLNVYLGIDPTATRIHLGHAFPLRKLQILSELGHNVTFLIGDFTAKIGDTSDKESERPVLTDQQIEENFQSYKRQAEKFLDFSKVKLVHNSEWLRELNFAEVLELCAHFSLNDFISRELIKRRLTDGKRVGLSETLYPIMQGYDSYKLNTDIQLGGTDQTFNMQAGRTILKGRLGKDSYIVANGFLPGTDGRKMSKTWGNAIWIEDAPEEIFPKIMRIEDSVILTYFLMGTNCELSYIKDIERRLEDGENPKRIKYDLASIIVTELYSPEIATKAGADFNTRFVEKTASEVSPFLTYSHAMTSGASLAPFAVSAGTVSSNSEWKDLLDQGGIYLNNERIGKNDPLNFADGENVVRVGKRGKFFTVEK